MMAEELKVLEVIRNEKERPFVEGRFDRITSLSENQGTDIMDAPYGTGPSKSIQVSDWIRLSYHPNIMIDINPETHELYGAINNFVRLRKFPSAFCSPYISMDVVYECATAYTKRILRNYGIYGKINGLAGRFQRGRYQGDARMLRCDMNIEIDKAIVAHDRSIVRTAEKLTEYINYIHNKKKTRTA